MNNAGALKSRLIVILKRQRHVDRAPGRRMSSYLARLVSGDTYRSLRDTAKQFGRLLPKALYDTRGPRRGICPRHPGRRRHDVRGARLPLRRPDRRPQPRALLPVLKNVRDAPDGGADPRRHQKGKGYAPAEAAADRGHAVVKFDVVSGKQTKAKPNAPAYTRVFGESLIKAADVDDKVVAITAAMPSGTGVDLFSKEHPDPTGLRRRHRRAARGDLRGGPGDGGVQAVLRDLLDVPAARLRPAGARRGAAEPAGALRARPGRSRRRRGATHAGAFDLAYLCCLRT